MKGEGAKRPDAPAPVRGLVRHQRVEGLVPPLGPYSQVVVSRSHVYVSGQVPVSETGDLVGEGNALEQARQVYGNLAAALAAVGCGWNDVTKLTVYLTDLERDLEAAGLARRERLMAAEYPASTVVEVRRLADARWLIEVDAIAELPGADVETSA